METQPISAYQESNTPLLPQTPFLEPKSTGPSRLPLFILGILTLIFAATSIYFFAKLKKVSFSSSPNSINLPSPTPKDNVSTDSWQTYTNKELGFELKFPQDVKITSELNDANNRATQFKGDGLDFDVMLRSKGTINFDKYLFMDTPITAASTLDGVPANMYEYQANSDCVSSTGPACPKSFVTYAALRNNDIYHLSFFGDKELSQTESLILGTFHFITPAKLNADVKTFRSTALGISFSYLAKYDSGETISTKEVGNKVYVYSNLLKPESGQYVEVFTKDASDTLEQAITKTILAGYSTSDCLIVTGMKNISGNETIASSNYKFARLDVPRSGSEDMGSLGEKFAKCPTPYASFGGMTSFLMDASHPDKFAFFSIGQYALTGDTDKNTWQDTFGFTN